MKKILLFAFLLLFGKILCAQNNLSSKIYENSYWIDSLRFYCVTAEYKNTSRNDMFLWFSKDESFSSLTNGRALFPHYIFKLHNDFSLFNLLSERVLDDATTSVFETFLKRMGPGETFKTVIFGEYKNDSTNITRSKKFLTKNVYYVEFPEVLKIADFKALSFDYFRDSSLIIPYDRIKYLNPKCEK